MREKAISIANLSYTYPDGTSGLRGISINILRGESVGVIGPNGAGKTTLLLHLNGILVSKNGNVEILGKKMGKESIKEIRRGVGLLFQDPDDQLFMPTVFDDVAFGPINMGFCREEVIQRATQALRWMGMDSYEKRLPHRLSVGEKKRIAIATVLSMSPEILVADEPTSNLDPRAKWEFIELLRGLTMTRVIASHDIEMVQALCERIIILDKGQIIADGDKGCILADIELLRTHGLLKSHQSTDHQSTVQRSGFSVPGSAFRVHCSRF